MFVCILKGPQLILVIANRLYRRLAAAGFVCVLLLQLNNTEDYFERKKIRSALSALKRRNSLAGTYFFTVDHRSDKVFSVSTDGGGHFV